jgi:NAD(P)-dependent dehydrogenase (short-subunit alcohol dehydrogenase family)
MPHDPLFSLTGKDVVVTGGLGQIGASLTRALIARGARVAVLEAPGAVLEGSRLADLAGDGAFRLETADVTDRASVAAALARVTADWGTPAGLVNAAGLDSPPGAPIEENGPFETYPEASWDKVMAVNAKGVMLCCQVIGGAMAEAGRGSIVNVASTYGMVSPDQSLYEYRRQRGETFFKPVAYSASKSALYNLTRYLATYWAQKGVRVNTLTPGGVFNGQDADFLEGYARRAPMGRMARESEYDGAVVFMLSDASSYMTGANLVVDGGWTAW